ncbi:DUF6988 family protein [Cupriavidus basilensis]
MSRNSDPQQQAYSAALALYRCEFGAFTRGAWYCACAIDQEVEDFWGCVARARTSTKCPPTRSLSALGDSHESPYRVSWVRDQR